MAYDPCPNELYPFVGGGIALMRLTAHKAPMIKDIIRILLLPSTSFLHEA